MIATDANLSFGTGNDEARGKSGDLLLIATNRPAGLTQLSGPGVEVLAARLE
jgi:hypothetical protein